MNEHQYRVTFRTVSDSTEKSIIVLACDVDSAISQTLRKFPDYIIMRAISVL